MNDSDERALQGPMAQQLLSAGVPRDEVLANLRATASAAAGSGATYTAPMTEEREPVIVRAPSAKDPLPTGWEERFDPSSGRMFYIDMINQTTSWTRPAPEGMTLRQSVSGLNESMLSSWQLDTVDNTISYPALAPLATIATTSSAAAPTTQSIVEPGTPEASAAVSPSTDTGFFGKLFGQKAKPKPKSTAEAPSAAAIGEGAAVEHTIGHRVAGETVAIPFAQPVATSAVAMQQQVAVLGNASAQTADRLQAASELSLLVKRLRHEAANGSVVAADVQAL